MRSELIDYKAVIDDLERRKAFTNARFDAAIAAIRQIIALNETESQQPSLPGVRILPAPLPGNLPYRDLGILAAARKHLAFVSAPVPNLKLAAALVEGGFTHQSQNFPNTLNSVLWRRAKTVGDVKKTEKGWWLTETPSK